MLAFHQIRVDRLADIMSGRQTIQFHRTEPGIHRQLHHLRTIPEHCIRFALTVRVQR